MHTKLERLLSKSLTTLEVMTYYLVVHTGHGEQPTITVLGRLAAVLNPWTAGYYVTTISPLTLYIVVDD